MAMGIRGRVLAGILFLGAAAGVAVSAPAVGGHWPQWRGPNRDGVSTETGLRTSWPPAGPPLVFKATGLGAGLSSVAVADGRIFTMGDRDGAQRVIALAADTGKTLWTAKLGAPWADEYGGPRGTPTVDAGLVFALGTEGELVALDAGTGKERWRRSLPSDFGGSMMSVWKFSESPLVDGDRVIVTPGGPKASMVALDKRMGREIWRATVPPIGEKGKDGAGYSSVVISNGGGVKQYVQLMGRGVVSVRASDGKYLWGYNRVANDVANISTPVVRGDHIFVSTGYQTGSALLHLSKTADGGVTAKEVYFLEPKTFQNHHGGMVLVKDHVYAGHGHNRGFPIAVELATGKVAWGGDTRNAGTGSAAVAYADGHLYMRYQNGVVMLLEASPMAYTEKGSFTLPDVRNPSWPHPVITGGRLYLREQDALYVYDVKKG